MEEVQRGRKTYFMGDTKTAVHTLCEIPKANYLFSNKA